MNDAAIRRDIVVALDDVLGGDEFYSADRLADPLIAALKRRGLIVVPSSDEAVHVPHTVHVFSVDGGNVATCEVAGCGVRSSEVSTWAEV